MTTGDACPGILDLHEARDGLVARIRLPGGYAGAGRLRSLAAMADRFGDGCVDVTARGNVQIRGIQPAAAGGMAQRAASAGFMPSPAHDRARNITASPLAGLAGRPDLRGLVRALDRAILADPGLAALPGRFVFSLDDGTGRAGLGACDVGLCCRGGIVELVVAGRRTGLRREPAAGVTLAIAAARAFVGQRRQEAASMPVAGPPGGDGEDTATQPGSTRAAGPRAGEGTRTAGTRAAAAQAGQGAGTAGTRAAGAQADQGARRTSARVSGLADGGAAVAAAVGGALGEPVRDTTGRLPLGTVPGAAPTVVVAAPLGRLTAAQVRLLARMLRPREAARLAAAGRIVLPLAGVAGAAGAADATGTGEVEETMEAAKTGAAAATGVMIEAAETAAAETAAAEAEVAAVATVEAAATMEAAATAEAALQRLGAAGLVVTDDHPLSAVTACAGTACVRSLADVRALATGVPGHAAVHWAGCARRCGLPADATAVVAVSADGFTVGDGGVLGVAPGAAARPA